MGFLGKRKGKHNYDIAMQQRNYTEIMKITNDWIAGKSIEEQCILIDYIMQTIRTALCANERLEALHHCYQDPLKRPYPVSYVDEEGCQNLVNEDDTIQIELSYTDVYVRPWNYLRTASSLLNIYKSEFQNNPINHMAVFYNDLKLCYIHNGNHSINAGVYHKKGVIEARIFNTNQLYPHYKTDGAFWYNTHDNQKAEKVQNADFAALFALAKLKRKITKASHGLN